MRAARLIASFVVVPLLLGATMYGAELLTAKDVPKKSGLWGVQVRELAPSANHFPAVTVVDIDKHSPASDALRPGYIIRVVTIGGGDAVRPRSASDFYHYASLCVPDCLLELESSNPSITTLGFRHVGKKSSNFRLKYDSATKRPTGYIDTKTGKGYSGERVLRPIAPLNAAVSEPTSSGESADNVRSDIDKIRSGPHETLPPAQRGTAMLGGNSEMKIENATAYTLYFLVSGPVSQRLEIPAGSTREINVLPGAYEIAARVSDPSVIPYYGTENCTQNGEYSHHFYISSTVR